MNTNIFLTGLTSSRIGGMELHNLGNYIIAEPLFQELRKAFPDARIATSIQMSDAFYERFGVVGRRESRFWKYDSKTKWATRRDWVRAFLWKLTGVKSLLSTPLLHELANAHLVIDFSGDIYGDNAGGNAFREANNRLRLARYLGKKTAMIIGSPGPFSSDSRLRTAKRVLPMLDLVTNREPISTKMLEFVGIKGDNILSTACPSVLFESASRDSLPHNADRRRIFEDSRPVFGLILCGWNMPKAPFNRWPREEWEYENFVALIRHLKGATAHRICIMSHQNGTSPDGTLTKGNDHRIIEQLIGLLGADFDGDRVFTLEGLYTAAESKAIIGGFDLLISGRIHGAVQGLSQGIPTAIIDYGHEPKAHKLQGFARVYGIDDYLVDPTAPGDLIDTADRLLAHGPDIRAQLAKRIPRIRQMAVGNFDLLKRLSAKTA